MNQSYLFVAGAVIIALSGCSSSTPVNSDSGTYFELTNRHVIERDLSVFRSTIVIDTKSAYVPPVVAPHDYYEASVSVGEPYNTALKRWLKTEGYNNIAWSFNATNRALLSSPSNKALSFHGSLKQALVELSEHLHMPLNLIVDNKAKVAGLYDFNDEVRLTHVSGDSLRVVAKRIVQHYGLLWNDSDDSARSWLVDTNYEFSADYYLITQYDDVITALETVLDGYPVYSNILESTGQVFIQEEL
ncbi:hypothetical protein GNP84_06660 [Aliivibrio fischeri]|uniref:hypothetical protein n=1 Tax=Aliivibrio fischeri TaxID=668 RepID=UPI0012D8C7FA|nr:hypothetical protein [Aliivibrio fischeri]MUK76587.1 hypothetical protein [Aliivibrio fischeri]